MAKTTSMPTKVTHEPTLQTGMSNTSIREMHDSDVPLQIHLNFLNDATSQLERYGRCNFCYNSVVDSKSSLNLHSL